MLILKQHIFKQLLQINENKSKLRKFRNLNFKVQLPWKLTYRKISNL